MSIAVVRAVIDCDGCGIQFTVELDAAHKVEGWSVADYVLDSVLGGYHLGPGICSLQEDRMLCASCTKLADEANS